MNHQNKTKEELLLLVDQLENEIASLSNQLILESTEKEQHLATSIENDLKYRSLINRLQDVYYEASVDGIVIEVSPSIEKISKGLIKREELIGRSFVEMYADPGARQKLQEQLAQYGSVTDYEVSFVNRDGSVVPVSISSILIMDESGQPYRVIGSIRDISKRKRAEKDLFDSRNELLRINLQMQLAQQIGHAGSWSYHLPTKEFECSDEALRIFGFENINRKVTSDDFESCIRDNARVQQAMSEFLREKNSYNIEYEIDPADGSPVRIIHSRAEIVADEEGKPVSLYGVLLDITERKRAERRLLESEMEYRTLADSGQALIWTATPDKKCNYFNRVWLDFTGRTLEQELGDGWIESVHPDDVSACVEIYEKAFDKREIFSLTYRMRRYDGEYRWILDEGKPRYDSEGQFLGYIGNCLDITDRKLKDEEIMNSEARYRFLFENNPQPMWIYDLETLAILEVNESSLKQYGYTNDEFLKMSIKDVRPPEDVEDLLADIHSISENRTLKRGWRHIWKDGSIRYVEVTAQSVQYKGRAARHVLINDITEKKQIEDELIKIYKAVEHSPVMTIITDVEGVIEYANPAVTKVTGYTKDELLGKPARIFNYGISREEYHHELWETIKSGREWQGEFENRKKNGEIFFAGALITPIFNSQGQITHFISVEEDITQRKQITQELHDLNSSLEQMVVERTQQLQQATDHLTIELKEKIKIEEFLRWNQSLLQLMSSSSPMGFLVVDGRTDEVLYINDQFCKIWGMENKIDDIRRGELKHSGFAPYYKAMLVEEDAYEESCRPLTPIENRKVVDEEIRFVGNRTVRKFSRQIRGENDQYYGRFYMYEDISERKQAEIALQESEQRFSLFMDYLPAVVFLKDHEGRTLFVNKFMENAFGASKWMGKTMLEVFPGELGKRLLNDDLNSLEIGYQKIEENMFQLDGQWHDYETQKFKIEREGQSPMLGGIALDITERKKAELKVLKAKEEAEKANQAKSEFLSRMSHELRTPMNSILGFAQLMEMGDLTSSQRRGVNHILSSGKHLLDLINEVLDISRIEAGRLAIAIEPVSLQAVFEEMMNIMKPLATKQHIHLKLQKPDGPSLLVSADRQGLKQVLLNLLNNAIKYNVKDGSVVVSTELRRAEETGENLVRISITDTGVGISQQDLPRLFTPFERIVSDSTGIEGTGLGLAVVKKLTETMKGQVGVESVAGEGSTFWIEFPQACGPVSIDVSTALDGISLADKPEEVGVVLYFEDNISNIELVEQILSTQRPAVNLVTHTNGRDAVKVAIDCQPALILLDVNLPEMNGDAVLRQLHQHHQTKSIPVVVVSADGMQHQINKLMKDGAVKYLTKPLELSSFLSVIDEFVK